MAKFTMTIRQALTIHEHIAHCELGSSSPHGFKSLKKIHPAYISGDRLHAWYYDGLTHPDKARSGSLSPIWLHMDDKIDVTLADYSKNIKESEQAIAALDAALVKLGLICAFCGDMTNTCTCIQDDIPTDEEMAFYEFEYSLKDIHVVGELKALILNPDLTDIMRKAVQKRINDIEDGV